MLATKICNIFHIGAPATRKNKKAPLVNFGEDRVELPQSAYGTS